MTLTYGSLFSGVGGFDLGFDRAGFRCLWQVEIDAAARSVLSRHWADVPKFTDVRDVGAHNLAPVDVITFGSPCQDLSVAGKRAGMLGERSGLFYEAIRIIRELRPTVAVWENVPGALSSAQGRDFGAAIDALADAGALDICWRVLDAQWFGVAQRRRRVFTIADFRGQRAGQILFEPEGVSGHSETRRAAGQDVAGTLGGSSQSGGFRTTDLDNNGAFVPMLSPALRAEGHDASEDGRGRRALVPMVTGAMSSKWAKGTGGPAGDEVQNLVAYQCQGTNVGEMGTLRRGNGNVTGGVPFVAPTLTRDYGKNPDNSMSGTPMLLPVSVALRGRDDGATAELGDDVAFALRSIQGGGDKPHVLAFAWQQGVAATGKDRARIVRAGAYAGSVSVTRTDAVMTPMAVRRLTPTECERLQGFPDGHTAGQADSSRYRQLGNAVAVPCAEWIARRIALALGTREEDEHE